jgi:hypothetical protein
MTATFEWVDGWITKIKESDDPWKEIWDGIKTWGEKMWTEMYAWIDVKGRELFNFIYDTVTDFANSILWGPKGDRAVAAEVPTQVSANASLKDLTETHGDLGFMTDDITTIDATGNILSKQARGEIDRAVRKKWTSMYNMSRRSDWAIQWTKIPFMHAGMGNWDILGSDAEVPLDLNEKILIASIMNAQPIVGGDIMEQADLTDPKLLSKKLGITSNMSEEDITGIKENAAQASALRWLDQNKDRQMQGEESFEIGHAHTAMSGHWKGFWRGIGELISLGDTYEDADADIKQIQENSIAEFKAIPLKDRAAIKRLEGEFYQEALNGKSISTHDHHLEELLKPVSKAFSGGKGAPPLVVAPDNRNQSVTKLGDTYSGGISSRIQETTAQMLAYTKNLDSTTGQFA